MPSGFRYYGKPEQFKIRSSARKTLSGARRKGCLQGWSGTLELSSRGHTCNLGKTKIGEQIRIPKNEVVYLEKVVPEQLILTFFKIYFDCSLF